jgi:hypothetical protein
MSKKNELIADLQRVGFQLGGAHLTRDARAVTFTTFANTLRESGFSIRSADQIGGRHLKAYAAARKEAGVSPRTLANEMSHLRKALVAADKAGLANNPEYSNKALGIERGSRIGTKQPLSDVAIKAFQNKMDRLERPGIGAVLELQRALGLREAEGIRGGNRETLLRWGRELSASGAARIVEGTKGGRPRETHPADRERALTAIRSALAFLRTSGQPYLVTRVDGSAINLKQAMSVYKNLCHREGIQSHAARYAFAQERIAAYKAEGFSEREARAAASLDLGHGDGRGRYIASVYARGES